MLMINIDVIDGLTNGAMGEVLNIIVDSMSCNQLKQFLCGLITLM